MYIDKYTDQSLTRLTAVVSLLGAIQWITKMPITYLGKAGALIRVIVFVIFSNGCVTEMTKETKGRT